MGFRTRTTHQAEIEVPQEGFSLDELKEHCRKTKVPATAKLRPAIVQPGMSSDVEDAEVRFLAEWEEGGS
jgi:hypothetical protein